MTSAVNAAPDGIATTDLGLALDYANPAFCRMTGVADPDAIVGRSTREFLDQRTFQQLRLASATAFAGAPVRPFEGEVIGTEGVRIPVEVTPSAVLNDAGRPWALLLVVRDISERTRAEAALRQSEERFHSVFYESPIGKALFDRDGRLVELNASAMTILGVRDVEDALGLCLFEQQVLPGDLLQRLRQGESVSHELSIDLGAISEFGVGPALRTGVSDLVVHLTPLGGDPSGPHGYLVQIRDVTESRAARRALQEKNRELERFVYTISHDLREPLVSISGFARLLHEDPTSRMSSEARDYLRRIGANAVRMNKLLADLLEFSRAGRSDGTGEVVHVGDVVGEVLDGLSAMVAASGAQVRVAGDLPVIRYHRSRLVQVFGNLIANAIKFRQPANIPLVEVGCERVGERWRFSVRDNGIGISDADRSAVFEIFRRLGPQSIEGTGIGLAIVKRIVEEHGGEVGVESEPGRGSTFWFTTPAGSAEISPEHTSGGGARSEEAR